VALHGGSQAAEDRVTKDINVCSLSCITVTKYQSAWTTIALGLLIFKLIQESWNGRIIIIEGSLADLPMLSVASIGAKRCLTVISLSPPAIPTLPRLPTSFRVLSISMLFMLVVVTLLVCCYYVVDETTSWD
jgi:hypothetical protein